MRDRIFRCVPACIVLLTLVACNATCNTVRAVDHQTAVELSSRVIYLTLNAENLYSTGQVKPGDNDKKIFDMATEKDPATRDSFKQFTVKFKRESGHAVVLVCTEDGSRALLEDTACKAGPDKKPWEGKEPAPCIFTIDSTYMGEMCQKK